ncbi:MAG: hypothetical protein ACHQRJ_14460 [Alphaproteobacteria bacterium]
MTRLERRLRHRQKRREHFANFFTKAKEEFGRIAAADSRASDFEQLYSFYIVPGGRDGGQNNRIVEVFFGQRPFDSAERTTIENGRLKRHTAFATEFGATLQYYRQDDDTVVVFLYQAGTRDNQTSGPVVILDVIKNPKVLTRSRKLKCHWRYFIAIMECSSIDGVPTWIDRMLRMWLWITRYEIKDNRANRQRMWSWLSAAVAFFFTVGLAGWALDPLKVLWALHPLKLFGLFTH